MSDAGSPACYEIRIDGVLNAAWFDGLEVNGDGGQTVISGRLADQPALHGLLAKIRDLGLCLITVRRLDPQEDRPQDAVRGLAGRGLPGRRAAASAREPSEVDRETPG